MPYNIFISYSTRDFAIVENARRALTLPGTIEVFIAEHNVMPGTTLMERIITAIQGCDLFILLWSQNSRVSDWGQQEIGIAQGAHKLIVPIVFGQGLRLPGFISDIKYLEAYRNQPELFQWLQQFVLANAAKQQQDTALLFLALVGILFLLKSDSGT